MKVVIMHLAALWANDPGVHLEVVQVVTTGLVVRRLVSLR